ncbi:unnamed protein product [Timema podura]|uniref:Inhibitor of growth protein N-terminal histone-binding domain-containing protein n=1 Tax=Timema podura TaxID=61482 RepID=A0ABN7NEX7_TIMPD|nr:unnamed protein product [Timema podura]
MINMSVMLNQAAVEALYSATFMENYLDCVESLPDDLQRYFTRMRELDVSYQGWPRLATSDSDRFQNAFMSVFRSQRQIRSPLFLMEVATLAFVSQLVARTLDTCLSVIQPQNLDMFQRIVGAILRTVLKRKIHTITYVNFSLQYSPEDGADDALKHVEILGLNHTQLNKEQGNSNTTQDKNRIQFN